MLDTDDIGSNQSANPHLADMIEVRIKRRSFLGGSLAVAATGFFGGSALASTDLRNGRARGLPPQLGFTEVPPSTDDSIVVPPGYIAEVLAPWGTPLLPGAGLCRRCLKHRGRAGAAGRLQSRRHALLPAADVRQCRGLLVVNHEYTDANMIYSTAQGGAITPDDAGREKVAKALAGHGVSVISIEEADGKWDIVAEARNRRITGTTPMAFSGPVPATHPLLQSASPLRPSAR